MQIANVLAWGPITVRGGRVAGGMKSVTHSLFYGVCNVIPFVCLQHLTRRLSRPAFGGRLSFFVSLRKTRFIQPHVLFTGVYLLKRLSAGFLPCAGLRLWALRQFQAFFASTASPPWRTAFSRFALVVNLGLPVLVSGSNRAVKPTRLRRAAYFRSLDFLGVHNGYR